MTTMDRPLRLAATAAIAGGAAWLAKLVVIAATDGEVTDTGLAAVFFIGGVILLIAGAATVSLRIARGRGRVAHVAGYVAAPVVFIASFLLLEPLGKAVVGDAGPAWLGEEAGIGLVGIVWLAVGIASRRRA